MNIYYYPVCIIISCIFTNTIAISISNNSLRRYSILRIILNTTYSLLTYCLFYYYKIILLIFTNIIRVYRRIISCYSHCCLFAIIISNAACMCKIDNLPIVVIIRGILSRSVFITIGYHIKFCYIFSITIILNTINELSIKSFRHSIVCVICSNIACSSSFKIKHLITDNLITNNSSVCCIMGCFSTYCFTTLLSYMYICH